MAMQPATWASFYRTINRLGPRLLGGVDPVIEEWLGEQAQHSDSFWSSELEIQFEEWINDPHHAARSALEVWVHNVRMYFRSALGPDSLFPFELLSMSAAERHRLLVTIEEIELRPKPQDLELLVDSVLIESATALGIPGIVVHALVEPHAQADEGSLIRAAAIPWHAIVEVLRKDWSRAYKIPAAKWEELLAGAFDRAGYDEVILTPRSGDHGRDVIAIKNGVGSIRIIGSVKAYAPDRPVRYDDVRALAGVLLGDSKASKGIVTTTSSFPAQMERDPFLAPLMPYRLELMDGNALRRWLEDLSLP